MDNVSANVPDSAGTPEEALRRERDDLHDRLLRTAAEFDNYRKRTDRERREQTEYVTADLLRDFLPVLDDLERALAAPIDPGPGADRATAYRNGFDLIRRQFVDLLRRRGVEPLDVIGKDFDPEWHEAVGSEPADGHRDGEVTREVRRGYRIGGRLLRPAMVTVAKA
jgi:molecular chaperone GrpE